MGNEESQTATDHEVISDKEVYSSSHSSDKASGSASSNDTSDQTTTFYHYTNDAGVDGIDKDKMIKASTDQTKDAVYGAGVYLTSKDPYTHSKEEIIKNNYDDGPLIHERPKFHDKADSAIAVTLPSSKVEKVTSTKRDVYLHKGDLDLDEYPYKVVKNK